MQNDGGIEKSFLADGTTHLLRYPGFHNALGKGRGTP
jgi:hypothetical protein